MTTDPIKYKLGALQLGLAGLLGLMTYVAVARVPQPHLNAIGFFLVLAALLYFGVPYLAPDDTHFLRKIVLLSLGLHIALVLFYLVCPWFYYHVTADANAYDVWGWQMAQSWQMGISHFQWPGSFAAVHNWTEVNRDALLYYALGHSIFAPEAMNIVWSTSVAVAVYTITYYTFGRKEARIAAMLTAFLPSIILWSTTNIKDPMTTGAIAWSVCGFVMLRARYRPPLATALILGSWFLGFMFRPYVGILAISAEVGAFGLVAFRSNSLLSRGVQVAMIILLGASSLTYGVRSMKEIYGDQASFQGAEQKRDKFYDTAIAEEKQGVQSSVYAFDLPARSPAMMIALLPLRVPVFFMEPFPVKPGSLIEMLTYPEQIFLYLTIPLFIMGVRRGWREERSATLFCLISVGPIVLAYACGTSIAGEAVRMRAQVLPVLFTFTGAGWVTYFARRAEVRRQREGTALVQAL